MTQTIIQNSNIGAKPVAASHPRTPKKTKALELYVKYHSLPREQIIQKFIDELEMPENSARTYVSVCAKKLNEKLGKEFKTRNVTRKDSKRNLAFAIFADNAHLDRKEIIEIMKTKLGISHNSAATHCSLASKDYTDGKI